jgi:hypothetical protein
LVGGEGRCGQGSDRTLWAGLLDSCVAPSLSDVSSLHRDAWWFEKPVPADTEGYFELIKQPMDHSTIDANLEAGSYADEAVFAADVRLVYANAISYSPDDENDCNKAARANLAAFERAFVKAGLATDGGAAAAAAEDAAKPATRKRQKTA